MPGKKKAHKTELSNLMEIPLLTNPSALSARTLLVAIDDLALAKMTHLESVNQAKRVADQAKTSAKESRTSDTVE